MFLQSSQWDDFSRYLLYRRKFSRKQTNIYSLRSRFNFIVDYFSDKEFDQNNITHFTQFLDNRKTKDRKRLSNSTINKYIQMVNNLVLFHDLNFPKEKMWKEETHTVRDPLSVEEILAIANHKMKYGKAWKYINKRMWCITIMMGETGCRVGELIDLELKDVYKVENTEHPYFVIFRDTKSRRDKQMKITRELYEAIHNLERKTPYAFESFRGKKLRSKEITEDLKERAYQIGITKRIYSHLFRASFATELKRRGLDIYALKELMGHADIKTTVRYINFNFEDNANNVQVHPLFGSEMPIKKLFDLVIKAIEKIVDSRHFNLDYTRRGNNLVIRIGVKSRS